MANLILVNKPYLMLCQFTDKDGRATLAEIIKQHKVYPAGRLDYDSEGLVLLTDDGALQHQISHPSTKLAKTYWVQVEGVPDEQALEQLRQGITLKDGPCRPAKGKIISEPTIWPRTPAVRIRKNIPTCWLEIILTEGRNRQVRRMTAAIGHPTLRLIRYKIGNWSLDNLQPGESKLLIIHTGAKPAPQSTPKTTMNNNNRRSPVRRRRL